MMNTTNFFANAINSTGNAMNAAFGLSSAIIAAQSAVQPMTKAAAKKTEEFKSAKAAQNQVSIVYNTVLAGVKAGNPGIKDADAEAAVEAMGVQKPLSDDEIIDEIIANDLASKKADAKNEVIAQTSESMGIIAGFAETAAKCDLEIAMMMQQAQQPQPQVTYAPQPAPVAPVPATEAATPTPAPATITTRKELGNELRSIGAAARGDRAMLHADSVEHPFTGNCKKWGASLFQEIANKAYTRSDYWKNK